MGFSAFASTRSSEVDQPCETCGVSAPFRVRRIIGSRDEHDVEYFCRYHLPIDSQLATAFDRFLQTDIDRALIKGFEDALRKTKPVTAVAAA